MSGVVRLLLHWFSGGFPTTKTFIQVDQVREAEFFEDFEGAHATATGLAVDEGGLGFVELGELGFKIGRHDVDVLGTLDVAVFELVSRADVDDGRFAFSDDLGSFDGFDMFGWVGGEGEGGNKQEESEEVFHGKRGRDNDEWMTGAVTIRHSRSSWV